MKLVVSLLIAIGCLVALPNVALAETYVVDSTGDQADENPGDETCETSVNTCTLRAAIEESNESTGTFDLIHFAAAFNGEGKDTIALGSSLPEIEDPVHIDGDSGGQCTTEAGQKGPCAGVNGPAAGSAILVEAEGVEIDGLAITGAAGSGGSAGIFVINGTEGFVARDDWLGVKLDGGAGANSKGIYVDPDSNGATIGGTAAADRNVFANNSFEGLDIEGASETVVQGNYFGVKPDGKTQAANGKDIEITDTVAFEAVENEVGATVVSGGGPCDGGCNVISGATFAGIDLQGNGGNEEPATGPTIVHGNYIGLSADGTETVANASYGVLAGAADSVQVGGPAEGDANFVAGGGEGIVSESGGEDFEALGNKIGFAADGTAATAPTTRGIFVLALGVTEPASIENNEIRMAGGVGIEQRFQGARIIGNDLQGGSVGIWTKVEPGGGLIAGNIVEAPEEFGIVVESPDNEVRRNSVFDSGKAGIRIKNPPGIAMTGNSIGGDTAERENVIEGSGGPAIEILEEALEPGSVTEVARNHGSSNKGLFIDLVNGANEGILPPSIGAAKLAGASGSGAKPGATIRVFRKQAAEAGELQSFLGEAEADGSGNWTVPYAAAIPGETRIAATQTSEGGTSELAFATTEPEPKKEGEEKDTSPPQTKIVKGPKAKTHAKKVKFKFTSSEAGSTFKCKLDKKPVKSCGSPKTYKKLKPGKHLFKVWAVDKAGNKDPTPAKRKFKILK